MLDLDGNKIVLTEEQKKEFRNTLAFWNEARKTGITKRQWNWSNPKIPCAFCLYFRRDAYSESIINRSCPLIKEKYCEGYGFRCCNGYYLDWRNAETKNELMKTAEPIYQMILKAIVDLGIEI